MCLPSLQSIQEDVKKLADLDVNQFVNLSIVTNVIEISLKEEGGRTNGNTQDSLRVTEQKLMSMKRKY